MFIRGKSSIFMGHGFHSYLKLPGRNRVNNHFPTFPHEKHGPKINAPQKHIRRLISEWRMGLESREVLRSRPGCKCIPQYLGCLDLPIYRTWADGSKMSRMGPMQLKSRDRVWPARNTFNYRWSHEKITAFVKAVMADVGMGQKLSYNEPHILSCSQNALHCSIRVWVPSPDPNWFSHIGLAGVAAFATVVVVLFVTRRIDPIRSNTLHVNRGFLAGLQHISMW